MCQVMRYNQNLSSKAGPVGKRLKFSDTDWHSIKNKELLFSKAGHGDADGMVHPNNVKR